MDLSCLRDAEQRGMAKTFEQVYREYVDLVAEVNATSVCGLSAKSRVNSVAP
jgi:hypothetical protein